MTIRAALVVLATIIGSARAEIPPPADELSKAYDTALVELRAGKDRQKIADRLKPVVEEYPGSHYMPLAGPFLRDLTASAKNPPGMPGDRPEERLADTRVPFHLLKYAANWHPALTTFAAQQPKDPVSQLVAADRAVIDRLIPLLDDRSPARCNDPFLSFDWTVPQARVCDVALTLIEYHGKVRFHHDNVQGTYLHQLPDSKLEQVAKDVAAWWKEVKDKTVAAGVRAQLERRRPDTDWVWMAKTLARLAEGEKTDDREYALNFLRELVKQNRSTRAADALAELGDTSAVDVFYDAWKSGLGRPGRMHDSGVAFYLCRHGGRREWELLHAISLSEVDGGKGPETGAVWSCVVNSGAGSPYAIPILGLALDQTKITGSRSVESGVQSFSYADTACELLQKLVGKDFGYDRNGTSAERLAAIKRAHDWWNAEGEAKYSFDYIEKRLVRADAPARKLPGGQDGR